MIICGAVPASQDSYDAAATGNLFTKQSSGNSSTEVCEVDIGC